MDENETEVDEGADAPVEETTHADPAEDSAWDGKWETLLTQKWVPEAARPHLEALHKDFSERSTQMEFLQKFFDADDSTAAALREVESLKTALGKAEGVQKEFDEYRGKVEEERTTAVFQRLRATYADIFDEKHTKQDEKGEWQGPWRHFYTLLDSGADEETAAKMVRATLPQEGPPKTREVKIPPAIAAANLSAHTPSATVNSKEANENFEQRAERMEREAAARGA